MPGPDQKNPGKPLFRLGIDLGGTKTEVAVLDDNFHPLYRKRVAKPSQDYDSILTLIADLVIDAEKLVQQKPTIGIGTPVAISPVSGLLRNSSTACLNRKPFVADIERRSNSPVKFQNDAKGLVVNRRLLSGPNAITGEWGHNPLPWKTDSDASSSCYCGKQDCIETFISGTGLARNFANRNAVILSSEEIAIGARNGETKCELAMELYYDQLARALAHLVNIIDPDAIVLGGCMVIPAVFLVRPCCRSDGAAML
jgi:fructokinase